MHAYEITLYWAIATASVLLLVIVGLFAWSIAHGRALLLRQVQASYKVELALLEERNRLGADLHDEVGPLLKESLRLARALHRNQPGASETTAQLQENLEQIADCSRRIAQNLLPPTILLKGLAGALEDILLECRAFHSLRTRSEIKVQDEPAAGTAMHLYRMVQEMVSNAAKHSDGSQVTLRLVQEKQRVVLHFEDDGKGYNPEEAGKSGTGLRSLQLRAVLLSGRLRCTSNKRGTIYQLHIPLRQWKALK